MGVNNCWSKDQETESNMNVLSRKETMKSELEEESRKLSKRQSKKNKRKSKSKKGRRMNKSSSMKFKERSSPTTHLETEEGELMPEASKASYSTNTNIEVVDNKKVTFDNGDVYKGQINSKTNMPHGVGTITYSDGSSYSGDWLHGKKWGKGIMKMVDESTYKGEFVNNMWQGQGVFSYANGSSYKGGFHCNNFEGYGEFTNPRGSTYKGKYHEGKPLVEGDLLTATAQNPDLKLSKADTGVQTKSMSSENSNIYT